MRGNLRKIREEQLLDECVKNSLKRFLESRVDLNESEGNEETDQMLYDLLRYLSKPATNDIHDDILDGGQLNTLHKAYNYFDPKGIVHDIWAIHYTNLEGYEGIQKNGFIFGTNDLDALAYSRNYQDGAPTDNEGWNFALPLDNDYLGEDLGYGDCGFLIKTDGVRAYHKGDHDDEIIFKGCMVKERHPFIYDEDNECWILTDSKVNACFKDIRSLIRFVVSK